MDERKKQLKAQWRTEQRKKAREAMPLPVAELKVMFDFLDTGPGIHGCDPTPG
jgi:hypothetical protein